MAEFKKFRQAHMKLYRANKHIVELQSEIAAFLQGHPHSLSFENHVNPGTYIVELKMAPVPKELGLIIGDAVNNIRSALDLMLFQMLKEKTGRRRYSKFPISRTKKEFGTACKNGKLDLIGPKALRHLRKVIRPYPRGNKAFVALNKLANLDKHTILIPAVAFVGIKVDVADQNNNLITEFLTVKPSRRKSIVTVTSPWAGNRQYLHGHSIPIFSIVFQKTGPGRGGEVVTFLQWLGGCVWRTLIEFEAL